MSDRADPAYKLAAKLGVFRGIALADRAIGPGYRASARLKTFDIRLPDREKWVPHSAAADMYRAIGARVMAAEAYAASDASTRGVGSVAAAGNGPFVAENTMGTLKPPVAAAPASMAASLAGAVPASKMPVPHQSSRVRFTMLTKPPVIGNAAPHGDGGAVSRDRHAAGRSRTHTDYGDAVGLNTISGLAMIGRNAAVLSTFQAAVDRGRSTTREQQSQARNVGWPPASQRGAGRSRPSSQWRPDISGSALPTAGDNAASPVRRRDEAPGATGQGSPDSRRERTPASELPTMTTDYRGEHGIAVASHSLGGAPMQGDVYLDGTLMGKWVARSLATEAARPASGSAGFDPRRNVFPTGAMIGG